MLYERNKGNIYIKYEVDGDQYVGLCDSSLYKNHKCLHALHISLVFLLLKLYRHRMLRGVCIGG